MRLASLRSHSWTVSVANAYKPNSLTLQRLIGEKSRAMFFDGTRFFVLLLLFAKRKRCAEGSPRVCACIPFFVTGRDDFVQLTPRMLGGPMGACVWIRVNAYKSVSCCAVQPRKARPVHFHAAHPSPHLAP